MSVKSKPLIYVIDDDPSVLRALELLLNSADLDVIIFNSAEKFLKYDFKQNNTCLVIDIRMPGLSGLDLQQKLIERGVKIPVIFLTAFDSKESRERARKGGAVGYFKKPVDDQALLDVIQWALGSNPT